MTKQATSIRLSDEAEQNIKALRAKYTHLKDKTAAIEFAVWLAARTNLSVAVDVAVKDAAARPPATQRRAKEKRQ